MSTTDGINDRRCLLKKQADILRSRLRGTAMDDDTRTIYQAELRHITKVLMPEADLEWGRILAKQLRG